MAEVSDTSPTAGSASGGRSVTRWTRTMRPDVQPLFEFAKFESDSLDQYLLIAIQHVLKNEKSTEMWDRVSEMFIDGPSSSAIEQHINRLRKQRLEAGESVPPGPLARVGATPKSKGTMFKLTKPADPGALECEKPTLRSTSKNNEVENPMDMTTPAGKKRGREATNAHELEEYHAPKASKKQAASGSPNQTVHPANPGVKTRGMMMRQGKESQFKAEDSESEDDDPDSSEVSDSSGATPRSYSKHVILKLDPRHLEEEEKRTSPGQGASSDANAVGTRDVLSSLGGGKTLGPASTPQHVAAQSPLMDPPLFLRRTQSNPLQQSANWYIQNPNLVMQQPFNIAQGHSLAMPPMGNLMGNHMGNLVGNLVGNFMSNLMGNSMVNPMGNFAGNPMGNPMGNPYGVGYDAPELMMPPYVQNATIPISTGYFPNTFDQGHDVNTFNPNDFGNPTNPNHMEIPTDAGDMAGTGDIAQDMEESNLVPTRPLGVHNSSCDSAVIRATPASTEGHSTSASSEDLTETETGSVDLGEAEDLEPEEAHHDIVAEGEESPKPSVSP